MRTVQSLGGNKRSKRRPTPPNKKARRALSLNPSRLIQHTVHTHTHIVCIYAGHAQEMLKGHMSLLQACL